MDAAVRLSPAKMSNNMWMGVDKRNEASESIRHHPLSKQPRLDQYLFSRTENIHRNIYTAPVDMDISKKNTKISSKENSTIPMSEIRANQTEKYHVNNSHQSHDDFQQKRKLCNQPYSFSSLVDVKEEVGIRSPRNTRDMWNSYSINSFFDDVGNVPNKNNEGSKSALPFMQDQQINLKNGVKDHPSNGWIPNIKCFMCERNVKEDHFSEHLFFGNIKCDKCKTIFENCQSFQLHITLREFEDGMCCTRFSYLNDPVEFIKRKLSDDCVTQVLGSENLMVLLKRYIHRLWCLETMPPWQHALQKCKSYLGLGPIDRDNVAQLQFDPTMSYEGNTDSSSCIRSSNSDNHPQVCSVNSQMKIVTGNKNSSIMHRSLTNSFKTGEFHGSISSLSERDSLSLITDDKIMGNGSSDTYSITKQVGSANNIMLDVGENTVNGSAHYRDKVLKYNDSTSNAREERENSVTSAISLEALSDLSHNKNVHIKTKQSHLKVKKSQSRILEHGNKKKTPKSNMNMVHIPEDDFYYISKKAIEQCPNCYEILCPSNCTVNCVNFLIRFICSNCELIIYIINDNIEIVTGDENVNTKQKHNIKHPFLFS